MQTVLRRRCGGSRNLNNNQINEIMKQKLFITMGVILGVVMTIQLISCNNQNRRTFGIVPFCQYAYAPSVLSSWPLSCS